MKVFRETFLQFVNDQARYVLLGSELVQFRVELVKFRGEIAFKDANDTVLCNLLFPFQLSQLDGQIKLFYPYRLFT